MFHKLSRILTAALVGLFVVSTVALGGGAEKAMSGTIQEVNREEGTITLKSMDGKTVELEAPAALLTGLQAGDAVEVRATGDQVTSIKQKGNAQQPGTSDMQPQRPATPGGTPRYQ